MSSPLDISESEIRERCSALLGAALEEANQLRHNYIGTEHLFNALTRPESNLTHRLLIESGLDPREVRGEIKREAGIGDHDPDLQPPLTPRAFRVLAMATYHADDYHSESVGEAHLLLALIQEGEGIAARNLRALHVDINRWIEAITATLEQSLPGSRDYQKTVGDSGEPIVSKTEHPIYAPMSISPIPATRQEYKTSTTPLLDKFGRDLTLLARQGMLNQVIGRDREIRAVIRTLARSRKNNPILLGDAGVGKTAIVEGLAHAIIQGTVPAILINKRVIQLDISTLVAGTSLRGQFEERLINLLDETRLATDIILFIDEIHTIVGAGDTIESNLDAANILKPVLSRGEITCIGATTYEEYRKMIAQDPALDRRFRTIDIQEPSEEETLHILEIVRERYEAHYHVQVTLDALQAAVTLSTRYLINRRQPDKALDLIDEACARLVTQTPAPEQTSIPSLVDARAVTEVLAEWTGIPVTELDDDQQRRYARMADVLRTRVIGQDHAIETVSQAISAHRAGLADPKRPIGVFLFLGPSGVGKTELAKSIAEFLFGTEDALIRLDMSEFYDMHTAARLIGSPPGYKDSQRGGQLTEALSRKPYSVVLLDEIEKAAPELFDIFLQIFDEGRIADARGGHFDARHAVWIMTSNLGSEDSTKGGMGFGSESGPATIDYERHLKRFFRVEFLNRLDDVIIFEPLNPAALDNILDLRLSDLYERLGERQITLSLTPEARALLLRDGYNPANGARLLRHTIERLLIRPLGQELLSQPYPPGTTLVVTAHDRQLAFHVLSASSKPSADAYAG